MEQTLNIINLMQQEGLFTAYAIGGGIAAMFYIEPITTFDLDIFIILPESSGFIISLSPLYNWLEKKGYSSQHDIFTQVLGAEYLIAIMLQTYRGKDKDRLAKFIDEADISMSLLNSILEKHQLKDRFEQFMRAYYGTES